MDSKSERWRYIWNQNGTLKEVRPPGGGDFAFDALFTYDALGRRLSKDAIGITCWLWNDNVPLHEWTPKRRRNEQGEIEENQKDLRTWLFEEESFVPLALFQDGKAYSIVTDHLGTPVEAYNEQGEEVWYRRLDMNGKVIEERSMLYTSYKDYVKISFLFQGQYYDGEVKLAYNRFRYYAPQMGRYISEDPIRFDSGQINLFTYVKDTNVWMDIWGLTAEVYKLLATKSGYYDVYEWGNSSPIGKTWLNKGDTWKIGETTDFRTRKNGTEIQNRYSKKWLDANNLGYQQLQHSPNKSAKSSFQDFETSRIKKFEKQFGYKPAGNKCYH